MVATSRRRWTPARRRSISGPDLPHTGSVAGGHRCDIGKCLLAVAFAGDPHVRAATARIRTDDQQIRACGLAFVGDAGWDYDHVAGMQIDDGASVAAKTHLG